jgi:recombination protein RecT
MAEDLKARVQQQAAATTEVAKQDAPAKPPTLRQLIERMKPEIARALPKHMDPDRVARIAMTLVGGNPDLALCTSESFLGALMTASQLGLEPGPLGEAYLVPYGRKVTFIPGYKGLIKLAWQSNQLKSIDAHVVYAHDDFDFAYGLEPFLKHKPTRGTRGEKTDVYACATFLNGGSAFVVMSIDDVEDIRARSKAGKKGPWVSDWNAMAQKTAIKQLSKFLPMSTELRAFAQAVALDGTSRETLEESVDDVIPNYVDGEVIDGDTSALDGPGAPS